MNLWWLFSLFYGNVDWFDGATLAHSYLSIEREINERIYKTRNSFAKPY